MMPLHTARYHVDKYLRNPKPQVLSGMISASPKDSLTGFQRRFNLTTDPDFARSSPAFGERKLWAAVIKQALRDLHPVTEGSFWDRSAVNRKARLARIRHEAIEWFKGGDFEGICDMLNLSPDKIRRKVLKSEKRFQYKSRNILTTHVTRWQRGA